MAATARKPITNGDLKRILPMKKGLDFAKHVEDNIHLLERSSIETASAMAEGCKQVIEHWGEACTNGIHSCVANSNQSLSGFFGVSQGLCEGCHKAAKDLLALSRETMECRSIDQFYNLQRKTASLIMEHWMEELRRINCAVSYGYSPMCVLPPD